MRQSSGGARYEDRSDWAVENLNRLFGSLNVDKSKGQYCHVIGSSLHKPPGPGGWIGYWESEAKDRAGKCRFYKCKNNASVGAHIQKAFSDKHNCSWYIIPSCSSCNNMDRHVESQGLDVGAKAYLKPGTTKIRVARVHSCRLPPDLLVGTWRPKDGSPNK